MSQYLFLFTIGPVQSFISQARKTQDLYAGSRLLSDLTKKAIQMVFSENGKVIFPFVKNETELNKVVSLPNRFIAEFEKPANDKELKKLGERIEDAVKIKFKQIADAKFSDLVTKISDKLYQKFDKQIAQHLDIHWLFLPFTPDKYADKFKEIERLLGGIKNVRAFDQNEETGRKCSNDGERNALIFKHNYRKTNADEVVRTKPGYIDFDAVGVPKYIFRLDQGEGLSAVSIVKRFYEEEEFMSTAEVALMADYKEALENEEVAKVLTSYQNLFHEKNFILECLKIKKKIEFKNKEDFRSNFDHQLFFAENINEKQIPNPEQLAWAKEVFPSLQKYFKTKYYALIAFDVDDLGKWLSGDDLKNKEDLRTFHERLSGKLIEFGKWAKNYLDTPKGQVAYAGGDDFLGFVNLRHLFDAMKELRSKFDEVVNCKQITDFIEGDDTITFSAGVAVAHYKIPLGIVLKEAKKAEDVAKKKGEKNAFALSVLKHSGDSHLAHAKWKLSDNFSFQEKTYKGNADRLLFLIELLQSSHSNTFIKNLNRELPDLVNKDGHIYEKQIFETEMKRLIKRSVHPGYAEEYSNSLNEQMADLFDDNGFVENFLELLNIADFLKTEIK